MHSGRSSGHSGPDHTESPGGPERPRRVTECAPGGDYVVNDQYSSSGGTGVNPKAWPCQPLGATCPGLGGGGAAPHQKLTHRQTHLQRHTPSH